MKLPTNQLAAALHELLRVAKESEAKSLFGLLLLFEQEIRNKVRRNPLFRIEKHVRVRVVDQRQRITSKLTRYIE